MRRISSSAPAPARSSSIVRHARALPDTTIFTSVAFGRTLGAASRAILRRCPWALTPILVVLEVLGGGRGHRAVWGHVPDAARELGEPLAARGIPLPLHPQVRRLDELRAGDESDEGGSEDLHRARGSGLGSRGQGIAPARASAWPTRRSARSRASARRCRRESTPPPAPPSGPRAAPSRPRG